MRILVVIGVTLIAGCASLRDLEPSSIPIEVTHVSHLTQHLDSNPTNYGFDSVSVGLRWRVGNFSATVLEGVVLENARTWTVDSTGQQIPLHGGLLGPREVFTGRLSYEIPLK